MQHLGLLGVLRHTLHLSLQLICSDWMSVMLQCERIAQIGCDLVFQLRLRHHSIERWFWIRILLWPDTVSPVDILNSCLIGHTLCERQCSRKRAGGCLYVARRRGEQRREDGDAKSDQAK